MTLPALFAFTLREFPLVLDGDVDLEFPATKSVGRAIGTAEEEEEEERLISAGSLFAVSSV